MDEDKWIRDKATQEDGAMANAGRLQPTPSQQAALEQVAREWLHKCESMDGARFFVGGDRESFFEAFIALLAAQRAAGLEAAAREARRRDRGAHKELYWLAEWLNAQAQEQRP